MLLNQAKTDQTYVVLECTAGAKTRHKLETLGLVPGGECQVISNNGAGLILDVRSSRLAIGPALAEMIIVEPIWTSVDNSTR